MYRRLLLLMAFLVLAFGFPAPSAGQPGEINASYFTLGLSDGSIVVIDSNEQSWGSSVSR
ncbi:MAG TPA: hypothetical protein VGB30_07895 [bacterium]|jgi:hypothetical protein